LVRAQDEAAAPPAQQQGTSADDSSAPTEGKSGMTANDRVSHLVEIAKSNLDLALTIITIVMAANGAFGAFAAQQLIEKNIKHRGLAGLMTAFNLFGAFGLFVISQIIAGADQEIKSLDTQLAMFASWTWILIVAAVLFIAAGIAWTVFFIFYTAWGPSEKGRVIVP
jgi:hypothetical protein